MGSLIHRMSRSLYLLLLSLLAVQAYESPSRYPGPDSYCTKEYNHKRKVWVKTSDMLQRAMNAAIPGDLIYLADGIYSTNLTATRTFEIKNKIANRWSPITLCGSENAILDGNNRHAGILIQKSKFVNVVGLTVRNTAKGIKMWTVDKCILDNVTVTRSNVEAIHIQYHSHHNTVKNCTVTYTGRTKKGVGEGVYLGSSRRNYNGDTCIGNKIMYNRIGPGVTAEPIDVKEHSRNGLVIGNILDGRDLCSCPDAVSLINVKGTGYRIENNVGRNGKEHFFKTSTVRTVPGSGRNNVFKGNRCIGRIRKGYRCTGRPANGDRGNKFY